MSETLSTYLSDDDGFEVAVQLTVDDGDITMRIGDETYPVTSFSSNSSLEVNGEKTTIEDDCTLSGSFEWRSSPDTVAFTRDY